MWDEEWNLWDLYNCEPVFEFQCPRQWSQLHETGEPNVRFCDTCQKPVHYCESPAEFIRQGELGRCVAVAPLITMKRELIPRDPNVPLMLGFVDVSGSVKAEKSRIAFWEEVLRLAPDLPHEPALLDHARLHIEQHEQEQIRIQKLMAEFEVERIAEEEARQERRRKSQAERERREALSNQEAWGQAGNCPKCGLSLRWDGFYCAYCGKDPQRES